MDITLLDFINSNRTPFADSLFGIVTETAGPFAWGIPILLFIIALIYKNKTLRNKAITLFLMVVIAAIFSNILKYSIDRTRPFKEYDFIEKLSSGPKVDWRRPKRSVKVFVRQLVGPLRLVSGNLYYLYR